MAGSIGTAGCFGMAEISGTAGIGGDDIVVHVVRGVMACMAGYRLQACITTSVSDNMNMIMADTALSAWRCCCC